MNPAPPVINARTRLSFPSGNHGPRLEGVHRRGDLVDLVVAQGGVKRQREYLVAQRAPQPDNRPDCRAAERRLARDRHRVVNQRFDAARREVRLQRVALAAS